jgi:hypothetical protein
VQIDCNDQGAFTFGGYLLHADEVAR